MSISTAWLLSQMDVFPGKNSEIETFCVVNEALMIQQPFFSLQCFSAMTLFYCAHWQSYVSGTLRLGKIDVTEAQCMIIIIHLISAVFGPNIWLAKVYS